METVKFDLPWLNGDLAVDAGKLIDVLDEAQLGVLRQASEDHLLEDTEANRALEALAYAIAWGDAQDNPFPDVPEVSMVLGGLLFLVGRRA